MRHPSARKVGVPVVMLSVFLAALAWLEAGAGVAAPTSSATARIAVFEGIAPTTGTVEPPADAIRSFLTERRLPAEVIDADQLLAGDGMLGERRYDLLIIPRCEVFPAKAVAPLLQYLKSGGRMIVIGGRPFSKLVTRYENRWVSEEDIQKLRDNVPTEKVVIAFSEEELAAWRRSSGTPQQPTRWRIEESGRPGVGPALRVDVAGLRNFDTLMRAVERPFPDDPRALTCFWARGSKDTPQLSLEWVERDGSRWIATVDLSTGWRHYALAPQQFRYWRDNASKGRGGAGDRLDPRNVVRLVVGLSDSHTKDVKEGDHTYWIADLGWSHDTSTLRIEATPPDLEILSPWYRTYTTYKTHTSKGAGTLHFGTARCSAPAEVVSPVARTSGVGFAPSRTYRWIPVVTATDAGGEERGTAASLLIWGSGQYAHSGWGFIGIPDAAWLRERRGDVLSWIGDMSERLLRGIFLFQAGTPQPLYFDDERASVTAEVLNLSDQQAEVTVDLTSFYGNVLLMAGAIVTVKPHGSTVADMPADIAGHDLETTHELRFTLRTGKMPLDGIHQNVRIILLRARQFGPRRLVRVRGGDFEVEGRPWVPFGINFWPLYVSGNPDMSWHAPYCYDRDRVARDLDRVRACGMNVVCIQFYSEAQARPTMDFLELCRERDIRAFISIGGGFPLNPNPDLIQRLIRAGHLAESDAVFAYDVAWEPHVGDETARKRYDATWRDWIVERYGSLENAEKDWGVAAPRDGRGRVTAPSDRQLLNDGPHRVIAAAYRRFLDDAISQGYGVVERAIREADPHHLVGVRTGYGGTGSPGIDDKLPFDLASGAKHLDFLSPEGYGHGPSWETVRNAGLTTQYARLVGGGKPVWWAEYGMSVYPNTNEEKLARQGELYANFARMFVESRANGGAGWWFPGGYRINEDSDYGIFDPDGTPRPAARANKEWAPKVAAIRGGEVGKLSNRSDRSDLSDKSDPSDRSKPIYITVDRELHPRGYSQLRARHEKEYLAAVEAGKSVVLVTSGTGTQSANTPLVAVGNHPCNGANPPKYLNAEFERFWLKVGGDEWREVKLGETVKLSDLSDPSDPSDRSDRSRAKLLGRCRLANTAEAAWLPPTDPRAAKAGGVYLVSTPASDIPLRVSLPAETPFLGDCTFTDFELPVPRDKSSTLELELEAAGRTRFGQHWRVSFAME